MFVTDDLNNYFSQYPNQFKGGGRKQQGRRRNYVERDPSAVSNYTRAASAQFMKQYADPTAVARGTQEAVNRVNAQRRGISEEQARKNYKAKKGSNRPDYINRNPNAVSDYTRAMSQEFVRQHTQDMVDKAPKSSRAAIKARQRQLKEMGLYEGAIDGKWGPLSIAAHNAATAGGASWNGNSYQLDPSVKTDNTQYASVIPLSKDNEGAITGDAIENPNKGKLRLNSTELHSDGGQWLGRQFPVLRQIYNTITGAESGAVQTNKDFSDSYLENMAQLGQVAYNQYRKHNRKPKEGTVFNLPLSASVYREMNEDGSYANFGDIGAVLNSAVGGNRQVEFTDGQMSGKAMIGKDGNVHWFPTDNSSFAFDPGQKEKLTQKMLQTAARGANYGPLGIIASAAKNAGRAMRYLLGKRQEQLDASGYVNPDQRMEIIFPIGTIGEEQPRYSNVPKYKQNR